MLDLLAAAETLAQALPPETFSQLGVVAVALLTGLILAYRFGVIPERTRADRLEAENRELHAANRTEVVPALVSTTQLLDELYRDRKELERRDRRGDS